MLRQSPDGNGYELTCAPENEAGIYAQALTLKTPKGDIELIRRRRPAARSRNGRTQSRVVNVPSTSNAAITILSLTANSRARANIPASS